MAGSKPDPASDPRIVLFKSIGLTQAKAIEAAKNPKTSDILRDLIETYSLAGKLDEKQAGLVSALSSQLAKEASVGEAEKEYVLGRITDGGLKSVDQAVGKSLAISYSFTVLITRYSCGQIYRVSFCTYRF